MCWVMVNHLGISCGMDVCTAYIQTEMPAFIGIFKLEKNCWEFVVGYQSLFDGFVLILELGLGSYVH